jgi:hypothetical protein
MTDLCLKLSDYLNSHNKKYYNFQIAFIENDSTQQKGEHENNKILFCIKALQLTQ